MPDNLVCMHSIGKNIYVSNLTTYIRLSTIIHEKLGSKMYILAFISAH